MTDKAGWIDPHQAPKDGRWVVFFLKVRTPSSEVLFYESPVVARFDIDLASWVDGAGDEIDVGAAVAAHSTEQPHN